jgi:photosystem II stability/assembly factor-like uncharacterized protein
MRSLSLVLLALVAGSSSLAAQTAADSSVFGGLSARNIGSAHSSGRISAIDATADFPQTVYVGAASGGVWRSTDGGNTFKPVFDEHVQSIGAIRIDPSNARTVWVGTGETNVRNSVSIGNGLYRSQDGGESFQRVGLDQVERIAGIAIDQVNSNNVLVCATGALWSDSPERGVYRTRDGGAHFEKVLYVDAETGCSDISIDPHNPNVIYAGMWSLRRSPDFFRSGGKGSGLYRSFDGGSTWSKIENGLPAGEKGRIAVAVAPSRSNIVYALVEAKKTALYRSDDMGNQWTEVNSSTNVQMRPFYFGEIVVDPVDADRVYRPAYVTTVSTDGGKTFSGMSFGGSVHPDHHALWINPKQPQQLLLGTDGGVYESMSQGAKWRQFRNLPVSQFYHVSADMAQPYNVYGGLQDNGSWSAPSRASSGIRNRDWDSVGMGDGFWAWPDPSDPDTVFSQYQGGKLLRVNRAIGEVKQIAPARGEGEETLRFNWNTPTVLAPSGKLYTGSQYLHVSSDRGDSWQRISPDLTTDNPQFQRQASSGGLTRDNSTAENHATLYSIAESPRNADVIWVGSDDGQVQLTRDGGRNWANLSTRLKGAPKGAWVSRIEASPHEDGTAYITLDDHRRGDMRPYLLVTRDFGASFAPVDLAGVSGYAWVIKQDPVQPRLLYLGTEFGLYISIDAGANWARFAENLPQVAVHDLYIHPRDHDLIVATHGRGIYIIDDLTPLRALTPALLEQDLAVLPSRDGIQTVGGGLQDFGGDDEYVGQSLADVAVISFFAKKRHMFGDSKLEIFDADDKLVTTLPVDKRRGVVRIDWPMRLKAPKLPPSTQLVPAFVGPRLPEGDYRYVLTRGKQQVEGKVTLAADPRSPHSPEDRAEQRKLALALHGELGELTYLAESLADLGVQIDARQQALGKKAPSALAAYGDRLTALRQKLAASSTDGGYVSGEQQLRERMGELYGAVVSFDGRPSASQQREHDNVQREFAERRAESDKLLAEIASINGSLEKAGAEPLKLLDRAAWEARSTGAAPAGPMRWWLSQAGLLGISLH